MKFLINNNDLDSYYNRILSELGRALQEIGQEVYLSKDELSDEQIIKLYKEFKFDIIFELNKFRSDAMSEIKCRHIAWIHDVFFDTISQYPAQEKDGDIVYGLTDLSVLGFLNNFPCFSDVLFTGVCKNIIDKSFSKETRKTEFSLCGYLPALDFTFDDFVFMREKKFIPNLLNRNIKSLHKEVQLSISRDYSPLRGDLCLQGLKKNIASIYGDQINSYLSVIIIKIVEFFQQNHLTKLRFSDLPGLIDDYINLMIRDYPRYLDRKKLVELALDVSEDIELWGPGWDKDPKFKFYHKGSIRDPSHLFSLYQRTSINLCNNTHGFGMHSRVLECMAVGGLVFMHSSPNDLKPGGILNHFAPDRHFVQYDPYNFHERAEKALRDSFFCNQLISNSRSEVCVSHLWEHRAFKILKDL